MMAKTFYDLTLDPQSEESVKPKRVMWRNIAYFREGFSQKGQFLHPTEDAAREAHEEILLKRTGWDTDKGKFPFDSLVFTIQVPESVDE